MPLITTHNYFAQEVLKKSSKEIKNSFKNKKNIYELFAQGFDPFIFYEFYKLKKNNIQAYCHQKQTDTFFLNFIKAIKNNNLINNESALAALFGHLTHYVLDSSIHPYVVYKTGNYNKNNPITLKYNGLHTKMEMTIDAYIYEQNYNQKFKDFKIHKYLITKEKFDPKLIHILNDIYEKTFNIKNGGKKYQKGCRNMYYTYKFIIEDKTGLKKQIYHLIDKITPKKDGVFTYYNSHITDIDFSYFNLEHKTWLNPWNNTLKSNDSFFDLYNKALSTCITLFQKTYEYLNNLITIEEYKKFLKDNSYITGFSWHKKVELKHLEF